MKLNKLLLFSISSLIISSLFLSGCSKKDEVNILATTDVHSMVSDELISTIESERKNDPNLTFVDAGDFYDMKEEKQHQWFFKFRVLSDQGHDLDYVVQKMGEPPLIKKLDDLKYDAMILGNHELVVHTKEKMDWFLTNYKKHNTPVLSANIYEMNGENYVEPYIIKNVKTKDGNLKLGILGLTIKEVGEDDDQSRELIDQPGFENKLYITDLVEDAKKWVKIMKEKENPDIIVAVAHTGEKPKKPKNPGNRIQDLATQTTGIDAIVAGHTHVEFAQHDYKNKNGEKVIVTQPAAHGKSVSKITFEVVKKDGKWVVEDKKSSLIEVK